MLTPRTLSWQRSGSLVELSGRRIFVRYQDGAGPPLLLLHGYPSSAYDWRAVFDLLPGRQMMAFDFLGFGLSDKPRDHRYSLFGQADLVEEIVDVVLAGSLPARDRLVLVGHDMGTSVATELLARDLEGRLSFPLQSALLFNGSIVLEKASLTISQNLLRSRLGPVAARLSNPLAFRAQFARIFSEVHPLTAEEAADQWSLLAHNGGHRIVDRLTYYLHERVEFAPRWHGALRDWTGSLRLAWAGRDPICTEAVLQAVLALRPRTPVTRWPELGHYPQLEDPRVVAEAIGDVL